jgi:hypothetical protein
MLGVGVAAGVLGIAMLSNSKVSGFYLRPGASLLVTFFGPKLAPYVLKVMAVLLVAVGLLIAAGGIVDLSR